MTELAKKELQERIEKTKMKAKIFKDKNDEGRASYYTDIAEILEEKLHSLLLEESSEDAGEN